MTLATFLPLLYLALTWLSSLSRVTVGRLSVAFLSHISHFTHSSLRNVLQLDCSSSHISQLQYFTMLLLVKPTSVSLDSAGAHNSCLLAWPLVLSFGSDISYPLSPFLDLTVLTTRR